MWSRKFIVSEKIAKMYPDLRIGIVIGESLLNNEKDERLEKLTREAEERIREFFSSNDLQEHPHIKAWRNAYKSFGVKPKKYRPSCEALIRRVLKGEKIPMINLAVNCYLLAELEFLLPCGGYDIESIDGDIFLRYSNGNEEFLPIKGKDIEYTKPGEIIYSDNSKVLTRRWNFRDSDLAKITVNTRNIVLFSEAPYTTITTETLSNFVRRLSELLREYCKGEVRYEIINVKDKLEYQF